MKILGIEHIGIAVKDVGKSGSFWGQVLSIGQSGEDRIEEQGVDTKIYNTSRGKIELLESLRADSVIARFIDKKGEGIHHICLEVEDIRAAIKELQTAGIDLIYNEPRIGAEGFLITFIHPKAAGGVLVELAQAPGH
ncbi:MAG: methylmalonyl-CoA epimerase [Candidatus Neomarinimicrobiota bacterium]